MFPTLTITSSRPLRLCSSKTHPTITPYFSKTRFNILFISTPTFPLQLPTLRTSPEVCVRPFMNYSINVKSRPPRSSLITPSNVICKYYAPPNVNFSSPIIYPCSVFPPKSHQVQHSFKTKAKM